MVASARSLMGKKCALIWKDFYEFFDQNSHPERVHFFENKLIQHFWSKFKTAKSGEIIESLRGEEENVLMSGKFLKDVQHLSDITSF